MDNIDQVREKIAQLSDMLLTAHPRLPMLLRDIHTQLKEDPEIVTLLTEAEICAHVQGLKRQVNVEITVAAVKGKPKAKITVDDI